MVQLELEEIETATVDRIIQEIRSKLRKGYRYGTIVNEHGVIAGSWISTEDRRNVSIHDR